jgi:hypothetical protein
MWELTVDTALSSTGIFTIELYNPSTGQVRWRDGHIRLQVEALIGPSNTLPFPDQSVTSNKLADGSVTAAKISDNTLPSLKITTVDRTITDTIALGMANTGTLPQLLSWLAKAIKQITGNSDWKTSPATTLAAAYSHMLNTSNPHSTTAAQISAVANAGSSVSIKSGIDSAKGTGTQGAIYIATDTQKIYRHNGTSWSLISSLSYDDLNNPPPSSSQNSDFGKVNAGGAVLIADQIGDALNLIAGSGISIAGNASTDTVTISSTVSGTPGAHTHPGGDITSQVDAAGFLGSVPGSQFLQVASTAHSANSGSTLTGSDFKFLAGSVNISVSAGIGTVDLPVTVVGYQAILAVNGDYDAYTGYLQLKDSFAGSDAKFTVKTSTAVTQTVRVNYMLVYW